MSNEFLRSEAFVKSELDYRTDRVRSGVRRSRRVHRLRRPAAPGRLN
ncbi:hypothetical protein [Nocardioides sp.]